MREPSRRLSDLTTRDSDLREFRSLVTDPAPVELSVLCVCFPPAT